MSTHRTDIIKLTVFLFVLLAGGFTNTMAQIIDPLREYTNPEEIVTFDKNASYEEAIAIINQFAQDFENKFIIDQSGFSGTIGVALPPMQWKDALRYIMRFNDLDLVEREEYYEIRRPITRTQSDGASGGGSAGSSATDGPAASTKTREIRIKATFFEGNKRALQEIGVDWSTLTNDVPQGIGQLLNPDAGGGQGGQGGAGGGANQQQFQNGLPVVGLNDQFVAIRAANAQSVSQSIFGGVINTGELGGTGISVQALFSAFEADNLGEVIATPSVTVVDGEEGRIQVGQDFSIKQRDIAGNVTDNFFSTGTILTVTPQLIETDDTTMIYVDVAVERSTAQPDVVSTIINKQTAETSSLLLDGEATYIAGLYRTEESRVRRGVPILKDLPGWFFGLKYLFGYNSKDIIENELVIIVQAELVEPISERIDRALKTKRQILDQTRSDMRNDLDRVFEESMEDLPVQEVGTATPDSVIEYRERVRVDTVYIERDRTDELTDEQKELAKKLSQPVENPELMVVVPKAFDLDQYLRFKENGGEVKTDQDLKYFVIGGSFIVQRNAYNFLETMTDMGYDTRMLYNTLSRWHFVALQGFSDFDNAVDFLMDIKANEISDAWLFTIEAPNEQIKE
ncbi:hypothetical protein AB2B38_001455 [Balneola sp. MJW-20]|uniref:hypothetical protein n=1 Tax=Gracilimonas aurantiaca TaxID=3234185 RepID=UPI0034655BE3